MLGYAAIIILLIIAAVSLYKATNAISEKNALFVDRTLPQLRAIEGASSSLVGIQVAAFALYGTTLSLSSFDSEFNREKQSLTEQLLGLRELSSNTKMDLEHQKDQTLQDVKQLKQIMSNSSIDWDAARDKLAVIQNDVTAMNKSMLKLKNTLANTAENDAAEISSQIASMRMLLIGTIISIAGITIVAVFLSQRTIANPVKSLSQQLDQISKDKDLTRTVSIDSSDEVAVAASSVNDLLSAFCQGTQEVHNSVASILNSVQSLSNSASLSDQQVISLFENVESMLEKIHSLESSIEASTQGSISASENATTGAGQVKEGSTSVQKTARSISDLASDIESSSERLLDLKNAGDQVSSVVSTIASIAEQTNLLALNAAIEAARAGESGRGFAVVADEVRTLASRTHESTSQINSILDTIVGSISATVESMDRNKIKANEAVSLAESTVSSLNTIQNTIISLSEVNDNLAQITQDAKSEVTTMRGSVDEIQSASELVTQSSRDTREASQHLGKMAVNLEEVVNQFKI